MCTLLQLMVLSFASIQSELKYFNQWRPSACLQQIRSPTVWFPFYADVHTNEQSHVYTENQSTNATHHKTNKKIFCNENHFKHKFQVMQLLRQGCRINMKQNWKNYQTPVCDWFICISICISIGHICLYMYGTNLCVLPILHTLN